MRQVLIVAGSNRTGTSLLSSILVEQNGFEIPGAACTDATEYDTHECEEFRLISRKWNWQLASEFAEKLSGEKILLKYPKASYVLDRWLGLIPDARVVYVYRPREDAVESQLKNWWGNRPFKSLARWNYRHQWNRGFMAMANLRVPVCFVTFAELKARGTFEFPQSFNWTDA
jgi:hypothetical protein